MLQKMQELRLHDEASNQHTSLVQRRTVPRAHPSTKERHRIPTVHHRNPSPNSSDMLRACKQLVQTPAPMHARFAHWFCLFAFECALLPFPVLANFMWKCITRHCSRTCCRRSKGRSDCVSVVLFVFVLFICRLWVQCINFRVPVDFLNGSGSYVHFCPRPRSEHLSMVLSCPSWKCTHRMCVIAKRLDCLHKLAHEARHGYFLSASTSRRSDPNV